MVSFLLFGTFIILLVAAVPVAISLGLASAFALLYSGKVSSSFIAQGLVTSIDSFPLMAVPFFILAGDLMGHGGLSRRLLNVGAVFFGRYTGGLAIIAVVTCMFFAAISGSGPATVAAIGSVFCQVKKPAMRPSASRTGWISRPSSGGATSNFRSLSRALCSTMRTKRGSISSECPKTARNSATALRSAARWAATWVSSWWRAS